MMVTKTHLASSDGVTSRQHLGALCRRAFVGTLQPTKRSVDALAREQLAARPVTLDGPLAAAGGDCRSAVPELLDERCHPLLPAGGVLRLLEPRLEQPHSSEPIRGMLRTVSEDDPYDPAQPQEEHAMTRGIALVASHAELGAKRAKHLPLGKERVS